MMTRSAGRATTAPRGGRTGGQTGRGGGRTKGRFGDQGNGRIDGQGGQVGGQGIEVNDGVDGVPDFSTIIAQQLQNLLLTILAQEFLAYNSKEYDGKGGDIVYTHWIEKMESVQDMSGCEENQKDGTLTDKAVRNGSVKKNPDKRGNGGEPNRDRNVRDENMRTRTGNAFATTTNPDKEIGVYAGSRGGLLGPEHRDGGTETKEGLLVEKRGNMGETSKDKNSRDDNKRTMTRNAFATIANLVGRENTGAWPKCTTCNSYHAPEGPCRTCFNYNRPCHLAKDYRGTSRNVNLVNARNLIVRACYECGSIDHVRAGHVVYTDRFHELARLVPHLVTPESRKIERDDNKRTRTGNDFAFTANPVGRENMGAWRKCTTCNSYHAPGGPCRTCFNCNRSGHLAKDCKGVPRNVNPVNARNPTVRACYECGSTDRVRSACHRLNRAQGPRGNYPNQVAANNMGQGCGNKGNQARGRALMLGAEEACQDPNNVTGIEPSELGFRYEIEIASGQLVEIDKVIKGMDWLFNHKAEIICHEKVVRIPLLDGKVLRVLGEKPKEKVRLLMSAKASDKKQEEIVVVRDFFKVFPDDLSRLPPLREIKFRIELILEAVPVVKSPYHLAPSKLEDFSGQLKELQDKELNKLTVRNCYPLLRIDDLFDQLQGSQFFSIRDLRFRYHQLRVHEDGIPKSTFRTHPSKIEAIKNWKALRTSSEKLKSVVSLLEAVEVPQTLEYRGGQLNAAPILEVENFTNWKKRFMCHIICIKPQFENIIKNGPFIPMVAGQRKPEEQWTADERKAANLDQRLKSLDTRSSHEYLNDLEEEYQHKPELTPTKDFEAKYNKVKAKLTLISSSTSASKASRVKNKGLIAEAYEWDEEEVSSDENEMVEVKVLMALAKENDVVSKEGARNGEWVKISMRKGPIVNTKDLSGVDGEFFIVIFRHHVSQ
nr:hypothetical protein [Tanacetum cinerariifolium]